MKRDTHEEKMIDNKKISMLYDSLAKELLIYIYSFVKSKETSEDILHDAFIRLLNHAYDYDQNDYNLRSILYTISRNLCIDHIRKIKRRSELALNDNLESGGSDIIEQIEASELQQKIDSFIEKSDSVSASIFIMKKNLNLTYSEIAERLNISERTAKRKMQKISQGLIAELKKTNFLK